MKRSFELPLNLQLFSEELGAAETGVEDAPAAEVQTEVSEVTDSQKGVEGQAAAEPEKQNNFEKAFAKRLAAEREKWDSEIKQKYGDYDDLKTVADYFREVNQAPDVMTLKEKIEMARLQERAEQENVPVEVLKRLNELETKAAQAEAYEKQQAEEKQYKEFRDDLDKFAAEKGVSGDDLYSFMVENQVANKEVALKALKAEQLEQQLETAKKTAVEEYLASKRAPKAEGSGTAGHVAVDTSKLDWKGVENHAIARLQAKINRE